MTNYYNRSEILSFWDLTAKQQLQVQNDFDGENLEENSFVILQHPVRGGEAFPLSVFMRTDKNNFTHGILGTSHFDGYFVTLSRSGDAAIIAHKYF